MFNSHLNYDINVKLKLYAKHILAVGEWLKMDFKPTKEWKKPKHHMICILSENYENSTWICLNTYFKYAPSTFFLEYFDQVRD